MRRLESDLVRVIEPRLGHKYACRYERVDTVSKLTGVVRNQSLGGVSVGLGLFAILKDTGLDPKSLELKVTESVLMKHAGFAKAILKVLRARGAQLAVDDFDTGYSSLSYLRKFAIDALKMDQSFVRQISATPKETSIVAAIISMGLNLNLRMVAEGVEAKGELVFVQDRQCDGAQDYYFGNAVPALQFTELLVPGIADAVGS